MNNTAQTINPIISECHWRHRSAANYFSIAEKQQFELFFFFFFFNVHSC